MEFKNKYYDYLLENLSEEECNEIIEDNRYYDFCDKLEEEWKQDNILAQQELEDFANDNDWHDYDIGGEG